MKHERPTCDEQIVLRVPSPLRDCIEQAAEVEGRTLAGMARRILERWVAEQSGGQATA